MGLTWVGPGYGCARGYIQVSKPSATNHGGLSSRSNEILISERPNKPKKCFGWEDSPRRVERLAIGMGMLRTWFLSLKKKGRERREPISIEKSFNAWLINDHEGLGVILAQNQLYRFPSFSYNSNWIIWVNHTAFFKLQNAADTASLYLTWSKDWQKLWLTTGSFRFDREIHSIMPSSSLSGIVNYVDTYGVGKRPRLGTFDRVLNHPDEIADFLYLPSGGFVNGQSTALWMICFLVLVAACLGTQWANLLCTWRNSSYRALRKPQEMTLAGADVLLRRVIRTIQRHQTQRVKLVEGRDPIHQQAMKRVDGS